MAYTVLYVGRDVPMADFDGWAARLRLESDGTYIQFFRAIASSADIAPLEPKPTQEWWTEFIKLAAEEIEHRVGRNFSPTQPPGSTIDLHPDVQEAYERARHQDPDRRRFPVADLPFGGVVVHRFGPGSEREERRRAPR